jgi:hypothetical protein
VPRGDLNNSVERYLEFFNEFIISKRYMSLVPEDEKDNIEYFGWVVLKNFGRRLEEAKGSG